MGLAKIGGLLAVPLLLNLLSLPLYGVWAIATVFISSQGLYDLGVANATVRYMAQAEARDDGVMARRVILVSLLFYTLLSLGVAALILPAIPQIPQALGVPVRLQPTARDLLLGAVVIFAISNYTVICSAVLRGLQRLEANNLAWLGGQAAYVGILFLAWAQAWGPTGVLVSVAGLYVTQTSLMIVAILRHIPRGRNYSPKLKLGAFLSYGWKIETIVLAEFVVLQAPKLLAGLWLGVSAAGRLDMALRLPVAAAAVVLPLLPPLLPAASRLSTLNDRGALQSLGVRAMRYLAVFTLPVFAAVFAFGPGLLNKWLGPNAAHLDVSVRLLAVAMLLDTLPEVVTAVAMGTRFVGLVVRYKLLLMLVTVSILPFAATLWGIDGICGAILAGFAVSFFYLQSKTGLVIGQAGRRQIELALLRATGAAFAAAAFGLLTYWILENAQVSLALWLASSLAFTTYVAAIIKVGLLNRTDIADLLGPPLSSRLMGFARSRR